MERRDFLKVAAGVGVGSVLTGCAATRAETLPPPAEAGHDPAARALRDVAVYVPGYVLDTARVQGQPVLSHRTLARHIRDRDGPARMLSRIGMDGSIRQGLLPVHAHQVAIAPDRGLGVLCGFEAGDQVAFDPATLDMVALAPAFAEGWRGGGHAVFVDGGKTVILSERAPRRPVAAGDLAALYGRVTIRDAETLKIRGSWSTHGIDPHDIRLIDDDRHLVIANYGSVPGGDGRLAVPRAVAQACVTVIEVASGKLVDKWVTDRRDTELRHLAAGGPDRIFAIQGRLGDGAAEARVMRDARIASEADITSEPGITYLPAATLRISRRDGVAPMGTAAQTREMRHGLSIIYDARHDQAIATYPSAHRLMVFDGPTGAVLADIRTVDSGLRYPSGVTLLPDGRHYAVTGYWENLFVYERGTHRLVRELCIYPQFFGHSHIASA